MADNQKYYYLRLKEDFFEDDAIQILEAMPDGYLYSNILLKLYLKSLKMDGKLMYKERIPYNATVLATITRHQVGTIEKALTVFRELGLVEILDNGAMYMLDIQNFIGKTSTEADRKREYRDRIEKEKKMLNGQMSGQIEDKCPDKSTPEIEKEKEKEKEIEKEIDTKVSCKQIIDLFTRLCPSYPKIRTLSGKREKAIKARLKKYSLEDIEEAFKKAEASDFLKGTNSRNWSANFDWIMADSNIAKILEGNYDNKGIAKQNSNNKFSNFQGRDYSSKDIGEMERKLLNRV